MASSSTASSRSLSFRFPRPLAPRPSARRTHRSQSSALSRSHASARARAPARSSRHFNDAIAASHRVADVALIAAHVASAVDAPSAAPTPVAHARARHASASLVPRSAPPAPTARPRPRDPSRARVARRVHDRRRARALDARRARDGDDDDDDSHHREGDEQSDARVSGLAPPVSRRRSRAAGLASRFDASPDARRASTRPASRSRPRRTRARDDRSVKSRRFVSSTRVPCCIRRRTRLSRGGTARDAAPRRARARSRRRDEARE